MSVDHEVLVSKEVAAMLRLSVNRVHQLSKRGTLPHVRIGRSFRYRREIVEAYRIVLDPREKETVYFIFAPTLKRIKIGKSTRNIKYRLQTIQSASPERLELVKTINGFAGLEKHFHRKFKRFRVKNEWFTAAPSLMAYIDSLAEGQFVEALL